jgi:outer membrane protein assembly factor BamB
MRMSQLAARSVKVLAARPFLAEMAAGFSGWRTRARVLTVAVASMLLAVGLSAAPAAAVTTSITLKPSAGPPTSAVTVKGTGFGASETVVVDFSGTQVATAATSATGTFSATFTVPSSALPGSHPVTATGATSGRSATRNFLVRTDWAKFHFDPANSGLNPYENVIGPANVSGLKTAWTAANPLGIGSIGSSPAVAGGVAYVGSTQGNLYAFSASGATGCSGTPKTCKPLWTGTTGQIEYSSPAVAHGVVYVAAADGKFYAFSAAGTTGCSGTPKTCKPLWTAAIGGVNTAIQSSPVVVNGVVYVTAGTNGQLYAFSAAGTTGCSGTPKTCTPLWTAANVDGQSSPAVAGGVVYVGANTSLDAFSAAGTTGCSGTPKTCAPLWTGTTGGNNPSISAPAVTNGVVYFGSGDGKLYAFSAAGTTGCSGTPKTCTALWTAATGNAISSTPAVAAGVAYIGSLDGKLYAFSAAGTTGCSGTPKTCAPLWTAANAGGVSPVSPAPAVANGVVYAGSDGQLYAFSAAGTTGCSGAPKTCSPLWATGTSTSGATFSSPAVANGMVYEGQWSGSNSPFSAYALP